MEKSVEEYLEVLRKVKGNDIVGVYRDIFKAFTFLIEKFVEIEKANPDVFEAIKGSSKYSVAFFDKLSREIDSSKMGLLVTIIFRLAAMAPKVFESTLDEKISLRNQLEKYIEGLEGSQK